jgi:hypothetical protein
VAADGVESEGAAVQDGLNPVRAESLPAGSRTRSNAIEARLEVPGPEAVASAEWPAAQVLDARQTERPAEADARVEPNRRVRAAIAAPSPLAPIAPDIQQPPLNSLGATRQNNQENPARVASPPLGEPAPPRRAAEHLARDLELDAAPAPEIHVSIGRIEVRAMTQPLVQPPRARPPSAGPALSLEAYLQKRLEGSR